MSEFEEAINVIKLRGFGSRADNEPVWNVIKRMREAGSENPMNPDQIIFMGVKLELQPLKGDLYIKYIGAMNQGEGAGSQVLQYLLDQV